ncbi:uncharacterized protein [Rutidosis leptorrhynchoides]|uniref:uncharacterized protein n=1 Tax=Rutidosis leptorrhynchoides TaxID=125765 RepID=UPI003A9942A4
MCPPDHRLIIGGDLNGHIGMDVEGYAGVHGGFGYGVRNEEGRSILEFAVAHDLVVPNSFFRKTVAQGDLRTSGDCKRRATKSVRPVQPKILWRKLNGEKAYTFKTSVVEKVDPEVEMVSYDDADQMWNRMASTIREVAKEALGVSVGILKGHKSDRESWWLSDEVQIKVTLKLLRFRELTTCREGTPADITRDEERYKEAKREAKKAVARAKDKEDEIRKRWDGYFSSLFIEGRPGCSGDLQDSDIEQFQNNMDCGRINKEEVRAALREMGRNKSVGPDQIPIEAWRCLGVGG